MHIQLGKDHTSVPRLFSVLLVDEAVDLASVYLRIPRKRFGVRRAIDVFLGGLCHLGSIRVSLGTPSGDIFPGESRRALSKISSMGTCWNSLRDTDLDLVKGYTIGVCLFLVPLGRPLARWGWPSYLHRRPRDDFRRKLAT